MRNGASIVSTKDPSTICVHMHVAMAHTQVFQ